VCGVCRLLWRGVKKHQHDAYVEAAEKILTDVAPARLLGRDKYVR
jgi:nitrogen fixation-related uncharacterized protein